MPKAAIPFAPQQASGNEKLGGATVVSLNTFIDGAGVIRKRPGIRLVPGWPTGVIDANGLTSLHLAGNGALYTVGASGSERPIYKILGASASALSAGIPPAGLRGAARPTIAETEALLVFAGGADMQKVVLATDASSRLGGSPPFATHVLAQAQRLLANDATVDMTKVRYSDTSIGTTDYSGNETWLPGADNTSGFFTGEARPDAVVAIAENTNNVYVLGATSTEIFNVDPTYIFARVAAYEIGCGAPFSVIKREEVLHWVDQYHRIVRAQENGAEVISQPIQQTLDGLDLTGCYGFRVRVGALDALVWTFPSSGLSFAFQQGVGWSQWSGYDGTKIVPLGVGDCTEQSLCTYGGYVAQFSLSAFDDLGSPIRAYVETGYVSHDDESIKECNRVLLSLKRGQTTASSGPVAFLKWRDRPGPWEEPIAIELGDTGDTEIVVDLAGLGTYRRRQWCFEFTGTDELALVAAVEEFEVTE